MAGICETCSVCNGEFEVQFRYQMEERDGAFSFFCSQKCLETSQRSDAGGVPCDACAKRFTPELVSQVLYLGGKRHYACSSGCRSQLVSEASGVRLGDIARQELPAASAAIGTLGAVSTAAPPSAAPAPSLGAEPTLAASIPAPETRRSVPPPPPPPVPAKAITSAGVASSVGLATAVPVVPPPAARPAVQAGPAVAVSTVPSIGGSRAGAPVPKKPEGSPRVIAVFNHKGGTGKTTTAVSLAAGLASRGKKVLLVDTDAQGNVSVSLGASAERSLYHVLVMGLRVADAVREVRPNLHLLPSNETLAAAELYLAGRQNRDRVLSERLAAAAIGYDFVVIDCSPSLSLMNQNALVFADSVLVPVACDYLSLVGVRQVIKTVKNVNALLHHPVQIWGVLPTFYDARAKIAREAVSTLKGHFGERCMAPIRAAIKVKEAPAQGQTIFEYADGTNAAEDYLVVVDRVLEARYGKSTTSDVPTATTRVAASA